MQPWVYTFSCTILQWVFSPDKDFLSTMCHRSLKLSFSYPVLFIDTSHSLWNKEFKFSSWGFHFFSSPNSKSKQGPRSFSCHLAWVNGSHSRSRFPQSWRRVQYPQLHWKYMLSRRLWNHLQWRLTNSSHTSWRSQPQGESLACPSSGAMMTLARLSPLIMEWHAKSSVLTPP